MYHFLGIKRYIGAVTLLLLIYFNKGLILCMGSRFILHQSVCICPGQLVIYECTTEGPGSTRWRGSVFNCTSNEIRLRHSQFDSGSAVGVCNDGAILARGIRRDNLTFISQLSVTIEKSMMGKTIQCLHHDGINGNIVGSHTISFESPPPPSNLSLESVSPQLLTFRWNHSISNCITYEYSIDATNCGICPSATPHTTCTCTDVPIDNVCNFTIYLTVCGSYLRDGKAASVVVQLKVPDAPLASIIPYYSYTLKKLISIQITIIIGMNYTYMVSNGINGSGTSYTTTYFNAISGKVCGLANIQASSCMSGICEHTFQISSSSCPTHTDINVTVFATNQLGVGPPSPPTTIGADNFYVDVIIDVASLAVTCNYLNEEYVTFSTEKTCKVEYAPNKSCSNETYSSQNTVNIDSYAVTTELVTHHDFFSERIYCFTVTATYGANVIKIRGTFNTSCNPSELGDGTSLPDGLLCDAPLLTMGIKNGVICYSSSDIGATAIYSCLNCGVHNLNKVPVRSCLPDGSWNGSFPECSCVSIKDFKSAITLPHAMITLIAIIILLLETTILIKCIRDNIKLKKVILDTKELSNTIYDEIADRSPPGSPCVGTESNIAYEQAIKVV